MTKDFYLIEFTLVGTKMLQMKKMQPQKIYSYIVDVTLDFKVQRFNLGNLVQNKYYFKT